MLYDIARYLFYLLSLWGLVYYTFQLRFIDFFTLSFFSAVIYFIPGYSGLVINPYDTDETVPLYEKCYWVYDVVLLGNLLSVVLYDYFFQDKAIVFYIPRNEHIAFWSCAIALIGFGMSLWRFPELYFDRENISKGQLQEILSHQADRWNIMWSMGAMFLALVAFEGRYKIYLGCAIVLI